VPFDRRVWQEARALRDAGYVVTVICPAGRGYPPGREEREGIVIHRHPRWFEARRAALYPLEYAEALFWETALAWRVYLGRRFRAVQICNPPDLLFLVALPFRWLGTRVVFDQHDLGPELYETKFGRRGAGWRLLRWCERATYRAAHLVLATNGSYAAVARERGGVPPDRVRIVRNGPDLDRIRLEAGDPAWKQGRRYLLVYVGLMDRQDGIDLLLEAMRRLVSERDDVVLVLAGDGPELASLQAEAARLGLGDRARFAGRLGDDRLIPLLGAADVCVAPDPPGPMNDKSTMLKTMEYMAAGKPVVMFDLLEGRVTAGEAALYARDGDPAALAREIAGLLDDLAARERMGRLGRERVERELAWSVQAPRYVVAFNELLGGRPPTRGSGEGGPRRV